MITNKELSKLILDTFTLAHSGAMDPDDCDEMREDYEQMVRELYKKLGFRVPKQVRKLFQ